MQKNEDGNFKMCKIYEDFLLVYFQHIYCTLSAFIILYLQKKDLQYFLL